jgi:hypothetical protein
LIDDNERSVLYQVLHSAGLSSDLIETTTDEQAIQFTRCKGGVFYAFCHHQAPLLTLRSLWTLTIQQLFPSLTFTDALAQGESITQVITQGQCQLIADRNNPGISWPLATAITARSKRTGAVKVPHTFADSHETEMDRDTDLRRQAYKNLGMQKGAALQDKFTPPALRGKVHYPANLDTEFQFAAPATTSANKEAIKDLALIHIDGNGLGILFHGLQAALKDQPDDRYCGVLRQFSTALTLATTHAAQEATQWLYETAAYQGDKSNGTTALTYLPMRPLVLGGDDVTLLCRADLALEYAKRFCLAFKQQSALALSDIYQQYLTTSTIKPYLTASGGILFHKAKHPFTHSHKRVEELTLAAKQLTKRVDDNVGPAALAFFRLSAAVSISFSALREQVQLFNVQDKSTQQPMQLGYNAYLVESDSSAGEPCFDDLQHCINLANNPPMSMAKWQQMAGQLALSNKTEADRIFERAIERCSDAKHVANQIDALKKLANCPDEHFHQWYWQVPTGPSSGQWQTVIADMLIVDHFTPVSTVPVDNSPPEVCQ